MDEQPLDALALADMVRDESRDALARLKRQGIQVMMLTGDSESVARSVARDLALEYYFAEVLPHDKADEEPQLPWRGTEDSPMAPRPALRAPVKQSS